MISKVRVAALCALGLATQGCGGAGGGDAAAAAQALLAAAQAGDAAKFEAGIDRPALRAELRQQIIGVGQANGLDVGGPSDTALDRMIGPQAVHLVPAAGGAALAGPPTPAQVAGLVKPAGAGRVCLHDLTPQQGCLLTFLHEKAGWRLVSMPSGDVVVAIPPAEAKK